MKLTMRSYQNLEDYWRIREFLRQVMILNHRRELSWHVARWDYWWWFINADLDLVAAAADGSIASFATTWFDDVSRTAYIEPVATVPAHQRHGLGKAVILEGLQRLKKMECQVAFVGGYSQAANALYFSVMGSEYDISEPWEKTV